MLNDIKFNFLFDFIHHQNTLTWSFNLPACAAENEILKIWLEHVYTNNFNTKFLN